MAGVYIHIPFCDFICYYCAFNKVFIQGQPVDEYIELLLKEIKMTRALHDDPIDTIYIGGGTPSALSPKQLDHLLTGINELLPLKSGQEFTVECNPNNLLDSTRLNIMKNHSVNRLSIGVQSFDDKVLRKIGRKHTAKDAITAIDNARTVGLTNLSIDLIFRLPKQDLADFKETLATALKLDLPHYATYSLILEQHTMFYNWQRQGKLNLPSEDTEVAMYQLAMDTFNQHGIHQYEISNFAKPGFESQHNLRYWHNQHYYGFGAGAYGYLGNDRYHNNGPIQQYMSALKNNKFPIFAHHLVPLSEQIEEQMFLGLRLNEGVSETQFQKRFGLSFRDVYGDTIAKLIEQGYLQQQGDAISLTNRGRFFGNDVFADFLIDTDT